MAKELKKIFTEASDEIVQGFTVQSWHVSQSVDALTGTEDYDITISGSLTVTGSVYLDGIEDAGGSSVYNLVLNQSTGEVFTTASLSGGGGADGTSGTSGAAGTSGTGGAGTSGTSGEGTSGTSGNDGSSGTSGATGDPGTSGTSGTGGAGGGGTSGTSGDGANGALIFPYTFQTSTNNPPAGYFRLPSNSILINNTDGTGTDISGFFDTIDDYGNGVKAILKLEKADDPTSFNLYEITLVQFIGIGATSQSGFAFTTIVSNYSLSDGDDVLVSFSLVGVAGTSGTSGGGSGTGGDGTSGTSGDTGTSGTSGTGGAGGGTSGTSGDDGSSGTSGTTGTSGNGTAGTSGTGGAGTSGTSGTGGAGTAGTSGTGGAGTSGTSGTGGAGTSGTSGEGTSGTSGNGTSGTSGEGTSGTSGEGIPAGGTSGQVLAKIDSTDYNATWVNGGGSQLVFQTASVANNGVPLTPGTEVKADSVSDTITFDFNYLISGSTNSNNDTIIVSSVPEPQIYTRKNSTDGGSGGIQQVSSNQYVTASWESTGPNHQDNTAWFKINADNDLLYDTTNYEYIRVLQAGLYEIDLQLGIEGNNADAKAQIDILKVDQSKVVVERIARGTYDAAIAASGGPSPTRPMRLSATWYFSQDNIDQQQSDIIVRAFCTGTNSSIGIGGPGPSYIPSNWFKVKKLTTSDLA